MLPDLLRQMGFETAPPARHRPRLGVSACLLGHPVRYDGGHRHEPLLHRELGPLVRFVEVCPEVAIGLPVPRPSRWWPLAASTGCGAWPGPTTTIPRR
jgi:hypothetical protein